MPSAASLAVREQIIPLSGTGAVIYRISSRKQEIQSQYEGVANWLTRRKATVDSINVFEFVVKRRKTTQHFDFKRFIEWSEAGRINWVVVQDLDRFGSKDPNELMGFLGRLRDAGCQLWTVADDMCMNDGSDAAVLMSCIKGMTSEKECFARSDRAHRAKQDMALQGRWLGGPIPYGFDVECRRDGQVLWRYVIDKARLVEEIDHRGHKTKSYQSTGVQIEGDRETVVNAVPARNRKVGETAWLVESIRADRKEVLSLIFGMYANEEATPFAIAKALNARGIDPIHGDSWYPEKIKHIVANPLYKGRPVGYKKTMAGYYRYAGVDEDTGSRVNGKAKDKSGKTAFYDRDEWIGSRDATLAPVVDPSVVDAAIDRRFSREKRAKAPKNSALWLSGLIVCDRCGKPMAGNMGHPDKRRQTIKRTYICSTYVRHGTLNPTGCKAHRCQHDVIERYLNEFLANQNKTLENYKDAHRHPKKLEALMARDEAVSNLIRNHANMLIEKINGMADEPCPPVTELDQIVTPHTNTCGFSVHIPALLATYEQLAKERQGKLAEIIAGKEAEFDRLVEGFAGLTNDRAKERANVKLNALDAEIRGLRAELPGVSGKVRSLYDELCDLHTRIQECRLALEIGSDQQKAEAARRAIKEIRLNFRYEDHSAMTWSKLDTITIVPNLGEPNTFHVEEIPTAGRKKRVGGESTPPRA